MDDVRYSELVFLQGLKKGYPEFFCHWNDEQTKAVGLLGPQYVEMAAVLIEDLYVRFQNDAMQLYVSRLRQELGPGYGPPDGVPSHLWHNPREAVLFFLRGTIHLPTLYITYRGLRRIEELRDLLKRDRVLEDFGVLLSIRYLR